MKSLFCIKSRQGFNNWIQRAGIGLIAVGLFAFLYAFQNCSRPYEITQAGSQSFDEVLAPALVINKDAIYTNTPLVQVDVVNADVDQVYVTTEPDCSSGGSWQDYVPPLSYTLAPGDEEKTVYAKFRGSNGIQSACLSDSIILDSTPPVITIIQSESTPTPSLATTAKVKFDVTDNLSGLSAEGVLCRLNQVDPTGEVLHDFEPCVSPYEVDNLTYGSTYELEIRVLDKAGNSDNTARHQWLVYDSQSAVIQLIQKPQQFSQSTSATFSFQGSGDSSEFSQFQCRLDNGIYQSCDSLQMSYSGLIDGEHSFDVKALDLAGQEKQTSYTWVVDTMLPEVRNVTLSSYNEDYQLEGESTTHCCATQSSVFGVHWEMRDNGLAGIDEIQVKCLIKQDQGTDFPTEQVIEDCGNLVGSTTNGFVAYQQDLPIPASSKAYRVQVIAVDRAGNAIPIFSSGSTLPPSMPQGFNGHVIRDVEIPFVGFSSTKDNSSYVDSNGDLLKPICERLTASEAGASSDIIEIWARDNYSTRYLYYDFKAYATKWLAQYQFCRATLPHATASEYNCGYYNIPSGKDAGSMTFRVRDQAHNAITRVCRWNKSSAWLDTGTAVQIASTSNLVSHSPLDAQHMPEHFFDGCLDGKEFCSVGSMEAEMMEFEFDLGSIRHLSHLRLRGEADGTWVSATTDIYIKSSLSGTYQAVHLGVDTLGNQWYDFALPYDARYVKLVVHGAAGSNRVEANELEIFVFPK